MTSNETTPDPAVGRLTSSQAGPAAALADWPATVVRAVAHLRAADPTLAATIERVGPCRLAPRPALFGALVAAILSQQISGKAARSIRARLETALGGEPTPERILAVDHEVLRAAGLSNAKARSVRDLAEHVAGGRVDLDRLRHAPDEEVIRALVPVRGIGRWTAEMFLIFSLGRLDVLPVDDLGVRVAIRDLYGFDHLPGKAEMEGVAEPWRPYRSIATWYLWRSADAAPAV